jgi:hypothetical protein
MGTTIGGIAIKTNTTAFSDEKILNELLKVKYSILKEAELYNNEQFEFDNRKPECISIYKTTDVIWIINHNISNDFFTNNIERVESFFNFFNAPNLMFAFNRYDSAGTYGYSIYKKGVNIRTSRVIAYEKEIDTGVHLPIEVDWFNSDTEIEDLGDGEYQKNYINAKNSERICPEDLLIEIILEDLLIEYLLVSTESLYHEAIERNYYRINIDKPITQSSQIKQSWWKKLFS